MNGRTWLVWSLCAALGCNASDSPSADAGKSPDTQNPGSPDERVGGFDLQLVAPVAAGADSAGTPGLTRLVGLVQTASKPERVILELDRQAGDCQLRTPRVPFCETRCVDGVCVEDDQCKPNPRPLGLGTVRLSGLKSSESGPISLIQVQNLYQIPGPVKVEYPPFAEGEPVGIESSGGEFPPFSIAARGIAPLELPADTRYPLAAGMPLELRWTPPQVAGVSTIHVKLDISHHGGSKGQIDCDTADDGAYSIDAGLIERLLALGVAGFPTVMITRSSVGEAATAAGKVDLKVYMYQERSVDIDGLISCTKNSDCPSGTCKDDQSCEPQ